ncbi:sensor histidine kinase [Chryseobacterium sp. G0201]|uniref:sensor histidine kinase n=1 Tax=Chryseobacterium sp. G0201 TaxID=2487065 RepID=UPI001E494909|nr:histidine kinase [Chryseobacterium sp. G0201]
MYILSLLKKSIRDMSYKTLEVQNTKAIRFITEDKFRLLRHAILLLGILAILSYSKDVTQYRGSFRFLKVLLIYVPLVLMCYININFLVPVFFFKGRYVIYFALLILLVILSLNAISTVLDVFFPNKGTFDPHRDSEGRGFYESIVILIPIILVTTMIKLFQRWMKDNQRINELDRINFKMELNELRNQMNPHFLFNTLNGIKSLIRTDPDKAGMVIVKLSEFLRYQLYENNEERTLLKSEINFLSNFLDLETIRRDNLSVKLSSDTDCSIIKSIFLPPNLFTTFVENAVKHSVNINDEESFVHVKIDVKDNFLHFCCINSKDSNYVPSASEKSSGLGLGNIKRRLELLYGHNHTLDIYSSESQYEIKLTIPL